MVPHAGARPLSSWHDPHRHEQMSPPVMLAQILHVADRRQVRRQAPGAPGEQRCTDRIAIELRQVRNSHLNAPSGNSPYATRTWRNAPSGARTSLRPVPCTSHILRAVP